MSSTRHELLADVDLDVLRHWTEAVLAAADVRVHKAPAAELVQMQFDDPVRGSPFFLGEVLFYECIAEVAQARGYGYALGQEPERALFAAVLDAALNARHPLSAPIQAALEQSAAEAGRRRLAEVRLAERTRVRFEVLEG